MYVLQHSYEYGEMMEYEETKLLGIYSSELGAKQAIEKYKILPGFCRYPMDCFSISKFIVNQDHWTEGFVSSNEITHDFETLTLCFNEWLGRNELPSEAWKDDNYYNTLCDVSQKVYEVKNATELAKYINKVWSIRYADATKSISNCLKIAEMLGILVFAVIAALILHITNINESLEIVKGKSFFSDFYIQKGKVYIKCELTIINSSKNNKEFQLYAILKDDKKLGLLKEDNLKGYNKEITNDKFMIAKKTTKTFSVVFIGDFAGTNKKHDRNLPEIKIVVLK